MNLLTLLTLEAGGPGSGRRPEWDSFNKASGKAKLEKMHQELVNKGYIYKHSTGQYPNAALHLHFYKNGDNRADIAEHEHGKHKLSYDLDNKDLQAGGPGSGCRGDNCGRNPSGNEKSSSSHTRSGRLKDEARQRAAKESYVGTCRQDKLDSEARQDELAKMLKGFSIPDQQPFDVLVPNKAAIEFKLKLRGKKDEITHHKDARLRKEKQARKMKLPIFTVSFDERQGQDKRVYYFTKGFGYTLAGMHSSTDPKDMVSYILSKGKR